MAAQRAAWSSKPARTSDVLAGARALMSRHPPKKDREWERPEGADREAIAACLALKPVVKIESIHPDDLEAWRNLDFIPNAKFRRARSEGGNSWEVFFGRSPRDVRRAVRLAAQQESGSREDVVRKAVLGIGRLLGYPDCCCRAQAAEPPAVQQRHFWRHVSNRIANPGRVPWELNPLAMGVAGHVPCSLLCSDSLTRAKRFSKFSAIARASDLKNPTLLFWGGDNLSVELRPEATPGERFRYQIGYSSGAGPDIDSVVEGDEIVLEGETTLILKGGRPYASLSGRAFLWWHKRAFQIDFWRAMSDRKRVVPGRSEKDARPGEKAAKPKHEPAAAEKSLAGEPAGEPSPRPLAEKVEPKRDPIVDTRALGRVLADVDSEFARQTVDCRSACDGNVVSVSLAGKSHSLFLAPRAAYKGTLFFAELPSFYVCIRGNAQMTTAQQDLLKAYVQALSCRDGEIKSAFS